MKLAPMKNPKRVNKKVKRRVMSDLVDTLKNYLVLCK